MDDQETVAARGRRLMRGGAALRASAVLGLAAAMALLAAGCGGLRVPEARLTHAEVMEYDGEVLTVRADLVNDERDCGLGCNLARIDRYRACVEVIHSEPCYGLGHKAESVRIISGSYGIDGGVPLDSVEEGYFVSIYWDCRMQDAVLEGCAGYYDQPQRLDPTGYERRPEPFERQDFDFGEFDFAELARGDWGFEMLPGDAVQVLFRFRIPGLTPGETVELHYADDEQSIELDAG